MNSHVLANDVPFWITVLSALLTPTIALVAVYIGWQQWRTNRNKLKLDLFERRMAIYEAARDLIGHCLTGTHAKDAQLFAFLHATRQALFLLDKGLSNYLFKEIYVKACELTALREGLPAESGDARTKTLERAGELRAWLHKQQEALEKKFERYLKLEH
jgi:hypothetical protein